MTETHSVEPTSTTTSPQPGRMPRVLRVLGFVMLVGVITGVSVTTFLNTRALNRLQSQVDELDLGQERAEYNRINRRAREHQVLLNVGTIQFIDRGYSVSLEGVSYTQDGLHLTGYLDNPKNLSLANVTLTARGASARR